MFHAHLLSLLAAVAVLPCRSQDLGSVTDYAPQTNLLCPNISTSPLIRVFAPSNQSLNEFEIEYVSTRQSTVILDAWQTWLGNASDLGYNFSQLQASLPTVGIALSGGGYRAAQYGAGVLSALDARNASAVGAGTGGLLQVASYLSAVSGTPYYLYPLH